MTEHAEFLTDNDGDVWQHVGNGEYIECNNPESYVGGGTDGWCTNQTRADIAKQWGPVAEGGCPVPRTEQRGIVEALASQSTETRTVSSTGGEKGVKPARYDLIPAGPLRQVAEHYGKGAEKYDARNWERGYEWSKSFGALMRHAWQFWAGENIDEETGSHHGAAIVFHALALIEFGDTHPEFDDRPKL